MTINSNSSISKGDKLMNNNSQSSLKESKMKITASTLMRLAGLSAILAGVSFVAIGVFHPVNILSSVTTDTWVIVHYFATALGFFGLFGLAGLYARQVEKAGWLGLVGFIIFSAWMTLVCGMSFMEAFILPRLATEFPAYVTGVMGMFSSVPSEINLGALPTLWNISGPLYIVGPLLFGIATFRARVFPRWAGALLILGAALIPVGALVPPEWQAKIMIPVGLAFVWLGYSLFSERQVPAKDPCPDLGSLKLSPVITD
jgi:hypothetical protein